MERNWKFLFVYPLPALLTSLPVIPFTSKEITSCTIEAAKGANKCPRNLLYIFFYFIFFTVLVSPSINTPESSNDFIILILSFVSSFEMYKVNLFPTLAASFPYIFLSNLFIAFEVKLLTNTG